MRAVYPRLHLMTTEKFVTEKFVIRSSESLRRTITAVEVGT